MTDPDDAPPKTIEASRKTLDVVETLWKLDGAGVTAVADELGMSKSTAYFHLSTLKEKGYVITEGDEYALSLRFQNYGEYVKRAQPLYDVAKPAVEELAEETGERAYCMVEQHGLVTNLCVSKGDRALKTDARSGTHAYMHATAAGKAILAHLEDTRVEEIIDKWGLPAFTDQTITSRDALHESLERGREQGYFVVREEIDQGLSAVGVPIVDDDAVHGAISIEAPEMRLQDGLQDGELQNDLLATANMIQVNLSYS
jgi:DNA-binding IclR family transcriptional regulator